MMKLFKSGYELAKMAKDMNGIYGLISQLEKRIESENAIFFTEYQQDLFCISYICRNKVIDRIEEYNWSMDSKAMVPNIAMRNVTLTTAIDQTIGRLYILAKTHGVLDEVQEILERGEGYYEVDKIIPSHIKNQSW